VLLFHLICRLFFGSSSLDHVSFLLLSSFLLSCILQFLLELLELFMHGLGLFLHLVFRGFLDEARLRLLHLLDGVLGVVHNLLHCLVSLQRDHFQILLGVVALLIDSLVNHFFLMVLCLDFLSLHLGLGDLLLLFLLIFLALDNFIDGSLLALFAAAADRAVHFLKLAVSGHRLALVVLFFITTAAAAAASLRSTS